MGENRGDDRNSCYYSISHLSSLLPGYLQSSPADCSTRAGGNSSGSSPLDEAKIAQVMITCPGVEVPARAMPDSHDCESDVEGVGGMEPHMKPRGGSSSSGSKRSRAADVHNLSEKRRRCRINEKMRALQNLIPNSTMIQDKASMLDEVIDYLKQLQLKIQMLSKKHGINFLTDDISGTPSKPPAHAPNLQKLLGRFPHDGAAAAGGGRTGAGMVLPVIQDYLARRSSVGETSQCYNTNTAAHRSLLLNHTARFGLDDPTSHAHDQHGSFHHVPSVSEELNRTNMFPNQQMNPRLTGRTDGPFQIP